MHMRRLHWFVLLAPLIPCAYASSPASAAAPSVHIIAKLPGPPGAAYQTVVSSNRRIVYLLQDVRPRADHALKIIDVSESRTPRVLSRLPLPAAMQVQAVAVRRHWLFLLYSSWPKPGGLLIIDVRHPRKPAVVSRTSVAGEFLSVTRRGSFIKITGFSNAGARRFRITPEGRAIPVPTIPHPLHRVRVTHIRQRPRFLPGRRRALDWDRHQGLALTWTSRVGTVVRVWKKPVGHAWRVQAVLSLGDYTSMRLLADPDTALATMFRGVPIIISLKPGPYDADRLLNLHHDLLATAAASHFVPAGPEKRLNYAHFALALQEAGVELLLRRPAGLPPARRVEILNDYGFWLSRAGDGEKGVDVLQKVVALAPGRRVAWLNLADAAQVAMSEAGTWRKKRAFARTATRAYAAYARVAGVPAPGARSWAVLNGVAASKDICHYVAAFYNAGRSSQIYDGDVTRFGGRPLHLDIAGDGKLRYVYRFNVGSAQRPRISATAHALHWPDSYPNGPSVVRFYEQDAGMFDLPGIVPLHNRYYVAYERPPENALEPNGGPSLVVRPNQGPVCRFRRTFIPTLTVNHAPRLCHRVLTGTHLPRVPTSPFRSTLKTPPGFPDNEAYPARFTEKANATLDAQAGPVEFGYFRISIGAGSGCVESGLTVLNRRGAAVRGVNAALLRAQNEIMDCRGSSAFLVHADKSVFMEVDGGAQGHGPPLRTLIRLVGDHAETVCQVTQRVTYRPARTTPGATGP